MILSKKEKWEEENTGPSFPENVLWLLEFFYLGEKKDLPPQQVMMSVKMGANKL